MAAGAGAGAGAVTVTVAAGAGAGAGAGADAGAAQAATSGTSINRTRLMPPSNSDSFLAFNIIFLPFNNISTVVLPGYFIYDHPLALPYLHFKNSFAFLSHC